MLELKCQRPDDRTRRLDSLTKSHNCKEEWWRSVLPQWDHQNRPIIRLNVSDGFYAFPLDNRATLTADSKTQSYRWKVTQKGFSFFSKTPVFLLDDLVWVWTTANSLEPPTRSSTYNKTLMLWKSRSKSVTFTKSDKCLQGKKEDFRLCLQDGGVRLTGVLFVARQSSLEAGKYHRPTPGSSPHECQPFLAAATESPDSTAGNKAFFFRILFERLWTPWLWS